MSNFSRMAEGPPRPDEYLPPPADSFQVRFCGRCPNAHILLLNAEGEGIAQMTITLGQAKDLMLKILQNVTGSKL